MNGMPEWGISWIREIVMCGDDIQIWVRLKLRSLFHNSLYNNNCRSRVWQWNICLTENITFKHLAFMLSSSLSHQFRIWTIVISIHHHENSLPILFYFGTIYLSAKMSRYWTILALLVDTIILNNHQWCGGNWSGNTSEGIQLSRRLGTCDAYKVIQIWFTI